MQILVDSIEAFNSLPLDTKKGFIEFCQRRYPLFLFSYQIFSDSGNLLYMGVYHKLYQFDEIQKYLTLQQMSEIRMLIAQHNTVESSEVVLNPSNVLIVHVERLEAVIRDLFTLCDLSVNVEVNRDI